MTNKQTRVEELSEKILKGLRKATKNLVETKAAKNENLVIGDKKGNVSIVPAKELLPLVQNN